MDLLFVSDNTECFSLDIGDISFPLAPQILEAEQNMELQTESSTNIRTNLNLANYYWKYKPVEYINLVHYGDKIYVPKNLCKRVINCIIAISNIQVGIDLPRH